MRNNSYQNEFTLQVHFHVNQTYFHIKRFVGGLAMKQRYKVTREWPIVFITLKTLIPAFVQEIVSRLRSAVRMLVVSRLSDQTTYLLYTSLQ